MSRDKINLSSENNCPLTRIGPVSEFDGRYVGKCKYFYETKEKSWLIIYVVVEFLIELYLFSSVHVFVQSKRTCEANPAGENRSLIFAVCVKSVPLYRFKLAHVVLDMAIKEFVETCKRIEKFLSDQPEGGSWRLVLTDT